MQMGPLMLGIPHLRRSICGCKFLVLGLRVSIGFVPICKAKTLDPKPETIISKLSLFRARDSAARRVLGLLRNLVFNVFFPRRRVLSHKATYTVLTNAGTRKRVPEFLEASHTTLIETKG